MEVNSILKLKVKIEVEDKMHCAYDCIWYYVYYNDDDNWCSLFHKRLKWNGSDLKRCKKCKAAIEVSDENNEN